MAQKHLSCQEGALYSTPNNRMQPDFGELALPSAADARRYAAVDILYMIYILFLVCGPSMNIGV